MSNRLLIDLGEHLKKNLREEKSKEFMAKYSVLLEQRDTSDVWRQFAIWVLIDPKYGVIRFTRPGSEQHDVIKHIAQLYTEDCKDIQTWKTAVDAAAAAAARSAAGNAPYAGYAARSAAYAARSASWTAAAVVGSWVAADDYVAEAGYAAPFAAVAVNNAAWAAAAVVVAGSWVTASTEAAARANMANKLIELIKAARMITTND